MYNTTATYKAATNVNIPMSTAKCFALFMLRKAWGKSILLAYPEPEGLSPSFLLLSIFCCTTTEYLLL